MSLSNYEIKLVNMIFNNVFPLEKRKEILFKVDKDLYNEYILCRDRENMIFERFDKAFNLKQKIEVVQALYKKYGFEFKDIHELLQNRHCLIYNYYNYNFAFANKKINY